MSPLRNYLVISGTYWAFTLTDGALRMLVVLYFYQLGYSPLSIASLFLFYELFGIFTNLLGGLAATRFGLKSTLLVGLTLQIFALLMLTVPTENLTVLYVMATHLNSLLSLAFTGKSCLILDFALILLRSLAIPDNACAPIT